VLSKYVCVAQLDRALGYGPRCRGFESSRARMKKGARRKSYSFFSIPARKSSNIKENDGRRICLLTIWNREMMNRNIIIYIK
jgi:hypothetical protein